MSACEERKDTDETCCLHDLGDAHEHAPGRVCCWCGDVYVPHSDGPEHGIYKPSNIEVTEAERALSVAIDELVALRAEIRDLKARLEATRRHIELTCPRAFLSSDKCSCGECTAHNAADLTIKNWRKP